MGSNGASSGNSGREKGAARNRKQTVQSGDDGGVGSITTYQQAAEDNPKVSYTPGDDGGVPRPNGGKPKSVEQPKPKVIAPTTAEVSQATATDATADTIETRKKKTKAKGRSITILNRAKGITDQGLTLGKRSLLGS